MFQQPDQLLKGKKGESRPLQKRVTGKAVVISVGTPVKVRDDGSTAG
jgi:hypothetical protein